MSLSIAKCPLCGRGTRLVQFEDHCFTQNPTWDNVCNSQDRAALLHLKRVISFLNVMLLTNHYDLHLQTDPPDFANLQSATRHTNVGLWVHKLGLAVIFQTLIPLSFPKTPRVSLERCLLTESGVCSMYIPFVYSSRLLSPTFTTHDQSYNDMGTCVRQLS